MCKNEIASLRQPEKFVEIFKQTEERVSQLQLSPIICPGNIKLLKNSAKVLLWNLKHLTVKNFTEFSGRLSQNFSQNGTRSAQDVSSS